MTRHRWRGEDVVRNVRRLQDELLLMQVHRLRHVDLLVNSSKFTRCLLAFAFLLHDAIVSRRCTFVLRWSEGELEKFNEIVRALWLVLQKKLLELDHDAKAHRSEHKRHAIEIIRIKARKSRTRQNAFHFVVSQMNRRVAIFHRNVAHGL